MKILVTGATGFLGRQVLDEALARSWPVRAVVRNPVSAALASIESVEWFACDLAALPDNLSPMMAGIEAVVHCAGATSAAAGGENWEAYSRRVNVEAIAKLFQAAGRAGVARWIQISTMSAHPGSTSVYGRTKLEADDYLRAAPPPPAWTILRPSLIYGPGQRGLCAKTLQMARRLPFFPVFGPAARLRPVFVGDIARGALDCIGSEKTTGKTYMLGGADETTLKDFMKRLMHAAGLRTPLIGLPLGLGGAISVILSTCVKSPPITVDNVKGIKELVPVDHAAAIRDWGWAPLGLDEGLRRTFNVESTPRPSARS